MAQSGNNEQSLLDNDSMLYHKPVLVEQVLDYLDPQPGKTYLDVTFGSGGHTRALLEREPTCRVIALDWDERALELYGPPLKDEFGDRLRFVWGNFALLYRLAKKEKIGPVDGILADFGTSQIQLLQRPGFSFHRDSPLDMRMAPGYQRTTAQQVVQTASEKKLQELLWQLGEERFARQIARALVYNRTKKPIRTTRQLAAIVEKVVPRKPGKKIHPATKTFQALRLYVNRELNNINAFLPAAVNLLAPYGRLVCISFHSLEDRLVKQFFKEEQEKGRVRVLTPTVVVGSEQEIRANPSARSAKLRAAERLPD